MIHENDIPKHVKCLFFIPTWGPYQRPFSVSGAIQYGDPTMGNFVLLSLILKKKFSIY